VLLWQDKYGTEGALKEKVDEVADHNGDCEWVTKQRLGTKQHSGTWYVHKAGTQTNPRDQKFHIHILTRNRIHWTEKSTQRSSLPIGSL